MSPRLLRVMRQQQQGLDAAEREVATSVRAAFVETFGTLEIDLELVLVQIADAIAAGQAINLAGLGREPRYRRLQARIDDVRRRYAERATRSISDGQRAFSALARSHVDAQLAELAVSAVGRSAGAAAPVLGPTTEATIRQLMDGVAGLAAGVVEGQVTQALAATGPRPPRSPLLRILDDPATDARTRTLIRTETMRSYRAATRLRHLEAGDILQGVQWIAALSQRTCLACLSRHGKVYPLGYVMESHPSCRCVMAPLATNTPDAVPETAAEWLSRQPEAFLRQKFGSAYAAFKGDRVKLDDFAGVRESAQWGRSIHERTPRQALAAAGQGGGGPRRPPPSPDDDGDELSDAREEAIASTIRRLERMTDGDAPIPVGRTHPAILEAYPNNPATTVVIGYGDRRHYLRHEDVAADEAQVFRTLRRPDLILRNDRHSSQSRPGRPRIMLVTDLGERGWFVVALELLRSAERSNRLRSAHFTRRENISTRQLVEDLLWRRD